MKTTAFSQMINVAVLVLLAAFTLLPLYFLVVVAVQPTGQGALGLELPRRISLEHFAGLFSGQKNLAPYLINSVAVAGGSTLLSLLIALPSSYGLSRWKSSLGRTVHISMFAFRMIPPIVLVIPYYLFLAKLGLLDTRIGLLLPTTAISLPLAVWILTGFFDGLPIELDEAAAIEGASPLRTFVSIAVPIASHGILVTAILVFIFAYMDYVFALAIGLSKVVTLPLYIAGLQNEYRFFVEEMMATALIGTLPILLLYGSVQRYMRRLALAGSSRLDPTPGAEL